jgi:hypothetical protein
MNTYKTEDGYTLYELEGGRVVDSLKPDLVDMSWDCIGDVDACLDLIESVTLTSSEGAVVIHSGLDIETHIYSFYSAVPDKAISDMPDSSYLMDLITYAVLEGLDESVLSLSLVDDGEDTSWTWTDDSECGKVIRAITFNRE